MYIIEFILKNWFDIAFIVLVILCFYFMFYDLYETHNKKPTPRQLMKRKSRIIKD